MCGQAHAPPLCNAVQKFLKVTSGIQVAALPPAHVPPGTYLPALAAFDLAVSCALRGFQSFCDTPCPPLLLSNSIIMTGRGKQHTDNVCR